MTKVLTGLTEVFTPNEYFFSGNYMFLKRDRKKNKKIGHYKIQ